MPLKLFCFVLIVLGFANIALCESKNFVIVIASYNNKNWYKKNLDSVLYQNYENWRVIYINDNSTDETGLLVQNYINEHNLNKIQLINNDERKGHLFNQYHAIHSCKKNEIIIILDGDDWLANENVFAYLNEVYQDQNVWLTYGQFLFLKTNEVGNCKPMSDEIIRNNAVRDYCRWYHSHVRTFYAGLFQLIKLEDLLYEEKFFPMGADVATMFPMLEMCGERFKFIPDILYIYNDTNQLNFHNIARLKQIEVRKIICSKQKYVRLEQSLF